MFCPKCGAQNVDGASFCRSCGANISLVPQALTGQLPVADRNEWSGRKPKKQRHEKQRREKQRREPSIDEAIRSITMGVAFIVVSILVSEYAPGGSVWWFWLLFPAFGCFAKGFGELGRLRMARAQSADPSQPQLNSIRQQDLPAPKTGDLRPPVPSVTERTTRHLGQEVRTRQLDSREN